MFVLKIRQTGDYIRFPKNGNGDIKPVSDIREATKFSSSEKALAKADEEQPLLVIDQRLGEQFLDANETAKFWKEHDNATSEEIEEEGYSLVFTNRTHYKAEEE